MTDKTIAIPKPADDELRELDKMPDLFLDARDPDAATCFKHQREG